MLEILPAEDAKAYTWLKNCSKNQILKRYSYHGVVVLVSWRHFAAKKWNELTKDIRTKVGTNEV